MKKVAVLFAIATVFIVYACSSSGNEQSTGDKPKPKSMLEKKAEADPKGVGEVRDVALNTPLVADMVKKGEGIYDMKCAACHKLTDMRVVGPGWKGITDRRTPEWIMNMTLNVDVMLEEDPAAQAMLKECLVRMPNQNLSKDDARAVLEFMYANDGQEVGK